MLVLSLFFTVILSFESMHANFQIQILHCNDIHARFLETNVNSSTCSDEFVKTDKCFGGFARLKEAALEAKMEAKKQNIPSIFLNAGDTFQGTSFYTLHKWRICAELITKMGFDVMSFGNHEFDDGITNLVNYLNNANTPAVCSNLNLSSEPRLNISSLSSSYVMTIDGKQIGVVGYLTPRTKQKSNTEHLEIYPEIPFIRAEAKRLKVSGIDIIIALGHSGIEKDQEIAKQIEEISLVVGGHSHTFMYSPKENPPSTESAKYSYPFWVTQTTGKKVPIVQAYAYTKYLGKLLVEFDDNGNVIAASGNPILLDSAVKKDTSMHEAVSAWANITLNKTSTIKGYSRTYLGKPKFSEKTFECTLGNLITDALVDLKTTTWTIGPIAFYQNGGIRAEIDHKKNNGALTVEDLITVVPFGNKIILTTLLGKTIRKVLESNVKGYNEEISNFLDLDYVHFSGMKVEYDLNMSPGNRIKQAEVLCTQCDIVKFIPLEDETAYQILMVSFLSRGGSNFQMIPNEQLNSTILDWYDYECLITYVEKNNFIYPKIDNRVIVTGFHNNCKYTQSTSNAVFILNLILIFCVLMVFYAK